MDADTWLQSVINGYRGTALVGVAARLRIPDRIAAGHCSTAALASATGTRVDRLRHLLRALIALGLLTETDDGLRLTRFGDLLRSDHPRSLRHSAAYAVSVSAPAYDGLLTSLSSDRAAFWHRFGADFYGHLADRPDLTADFNRMLAQPELARAVAGAVDLRGVHTVVDVGGGDGALLAELLRAHEHVHGLLFDLPGTLAGGSGPLDDPDLAGRWRAVPGDFRESVPARGQVYLLARVLANWPDEDAVLILRNCRNAMRDSDRLVVVEQLLPRCADVGEAGYLANMDLLVNFGGQLRGESEHERLLDAANLCLRDVQRLRVEGHDRWAALTVARR